MTSTVIETIEEAGRAEGLIGRSVLRVEDFPLVTGTGVFVADVNRENQVWARIVRSPVAHGRLVAVHAEEARGRSGVLAVVTAFDVPDVRIPIRAALWETPQLERALQPPLARDRVRYVGEPVAVVVAADPYVAEDAACSIWAEVDELDPVIDVLLAAGPDVPVLHPETGNNVIERVGWKYGEDVEALFDEADVVVRERLHVHRHTGVPMEPRGLVAELDPTTGRLTVWGVAKVKHFNLTVLSQMLALPEERIRFFECEVGGGFGVRGEFYPEDFLIPWLAIHLGRPVKWVEDRREHFMAANHAREQDHELEMAASRDGQLLAFRDRGWLSFGGYVRTHGMVVALSTGWHLPGPYAWRGYEIEALIVLTNKTPAATYRGPGAFEGTFLRERMIDLVADELGVNPGELRHENLIPREAIPFRVQFREGIGEFVHESGDYPGSWEQLLAHARYSELRREQRERTERGEKVGIGLAAFVELGALGPYEEARIVPEADGFFTVYLGIAAVGQGVRTVLGQVAADQLGVPLEKVAISYQDTDEIPVGFGAFASRATVLGGNAIADAVQDLETKARVAAAEAFGVSEDEVEVAAGYARVREDGDLGLSLSALGCIGEGRFDKPNPSLSYGATLALVSVDASTGRVAVERLIVAYDVGRAVNPMLLRGQIAGAAAQGIAGTLFEELVYDDNGQPLATSFVDYLMPTAADLPEVDVLVLEHPVPGNPLGLKGGGEGGITGTGGALANAVADALRERHAQVTRLPLSSEVVRAILREA